MPAKKKKSATVRGIKMWECSRCGEWKPEEDFNTDRSLSNGLASLCRDCSKKAHITYRSKHSDRIRRTKQVYSKTKRGRRVSRRSATGWAKRNKEKVRAQRKLQYAIRTGSIIRPDRCEKCSRRRSVEGHHKDYAVPLDVQWLCRKCHTKLRRSSRIIRRVVR